MEKEKQIAFDRIREQWMALALTGQVREEINRQIRRGAVDRIAGECGEIYGFL